MKRWHDEKAATGARASDAELVEAARRGDKRAFVEIVARHQAMVCGVALGVLGDFAASEDAGQEAFLTAWRKFHELREPERLRAWLAQIARHAALMHRRRRRPYDSLEDAADLPDPSPAPDELAASGEEAALVRDALARLPETYREPLILHYRQDQSTKAVAEALGLTEEAVRQRLARGREMLRDRMSGLVENVLSRTRPTAIFTMTIAVAIGALATPAAVAGGVFAAAAGTASTATSSTSFLTLMSTSKALLIAAVVVTAISIPVGYQWRGHAEPPAPTPAPAAARVEAAAPPEKAPPSFEGSALFAEWKQLHETYGTTPEAMPGIYQAIAAVRDPFRRRAFRAALIAEWVQLDPAAGLSFFSRQGDTIQRRQFLEEWLARDARKAVDTLLASGPGWETMARDSLTEIARRVPGRVAEIVARLPQSDDPSFWDSKVRDAFAIVAEGSLASTRAAAEALTGPNRDQALAGVAQAWAKSDLEAAISWAKALPDGTDRHEIVRAALIGKAKLDPGAALDAADLVPPGGKSGYFASTTGARVLQEAAGADFDATVAWLAAHPGRFDHEDMLGLAATVTKKLNADPAGFLTQHADAGSLKAILPALNSALLNNGSGQRTAVWDWLKTRPEDETTKQLKSTVLRTAGYQDPALALRLAGELPPTPEADSELASLAHGMLNGGAKLTRFDGLIAQAPERLQQPLIQAAFNVLQPDNIGDPQRWVARLDQLPEAQRPAGVKSIARAWAAQSPEEAIGWAGSLAAGETRAGAVAEITSTWAAKDSQGASAWVASMPPGAERDGSAKSLVFAIAEQFPREAWEWALSIGDESTRFTAATHTARLVAARDPATARQWIDSAPVAPDARAALQSALGAANVSSQPP